MEPAHRKELERWAEGLMRSGVAELRAAGRAIRSLCVENDALEQRLARLEGQARSEPRPSPEAADDAAGSRPRWAEGARWQRVLIAVAAVAVIGAVVALAARAAAPELTVAGPAQDALIGSGGLSKLEVSAAATDAEWVLDGKPLTPRRAGGRTVWRPARLADGTHVVSVRRQGRFLASASRTFRFTVDTKAPLLELDAPAAAHPREALELSGAVEPGAKLRRGETVVPLAADGTFRLVLEPSPRRLVLTATDAAGNASRWRVPVTVVARRPAQPIRGVHVTQYAWADEDFRREVLALVRARKINAVELDLKDESGEVGWSSGVPLATRMGAQLDIYDLGRAVEQLHRLGVRVIGRLVCFRDPIHAAAAWRAGRRVEVIQAPGGTPYSKYGGFTNFAHPAVRKYNIDLAVAAAKLGVDEILYDYVRRPDGPLPSMVFPGLRGTPECAIVEFLRQSRVALAGSVLVGASVFGVAATRPREVAQDVPAMARQVDYIAPMLYPSHWGPGEYSVADPNGQPYEIVRRSTVDFVKQVRGSGARVVNWLQDFSLGRTYGPAEVRAQIRASRDAGVDEFILWDAAVTYTPDALDPTAAVPALGENAEPPDDAPPPVRVS